jgi:hypothetical protein
MRNLLLGLAALAAVLVAADASAHGRGRARVHVYWGPAWYWGPAYYYPAPVYYYPVRPAEPQEYVERIDPAEQGWWYYCEQSQGYYPHVKECANGWTRVAPAPAAPPAAPVPPAAPTPPAGPG